MTSSGARLNFMDFVRHSIGWARGEIFEMTIIGVFGVAILGIGLLFWRFGASPTARAMLLPLAVLGLLYIGVGASGYVANLHRIPAFERAYGEDSAAFIRAEKKRVEGFQYLYTVTLVVAPLGFAVSVGLFWLTLNPHARAVGIALAVFCLSFLAIDAFSKERADIYYARVLEALDRPSPTQASDPGP